MIFCHVHSLFQLGLFDGKLPLSQLLRLLQFLANELFSNCSLHGSLILLCSSQISCFLIPDELIFEFGIIRLAFVFFALLSIFLLLRSITKNLDSSLPGLILSLGPSFIFRSLTIHDLGPEVLLLQLFFFCNMFLSFELLAL